MVYQIASALKRKNKKKNSTLWKGRNNRIWFKIKDDVLAKLDGTGRNQVRRRQNYNLKETIVGRFNLTFEDNYDVHTIDCSVVKFCKFIGEGFSNNLIT